MEVDPEAGPSRPRKATQSNSQRSNRRRRRSSSPEDDGADVINPPQPKRKKTAQELQISYAQGWETRRVNIWAERVLPTYSTGKCFLDPAFLTVTIVPLTSWLTDSRP